jgi:hypothetical protein
MEAFEAMPKIQASEVAQRAKNYADELVRHLEELDTEYPKPAEMSEQTFQELHTQDGQLPGPSARRFHGRFQRLFYEAISAHYLIVPD